MAFLKRDLKPPPGDQKRALGRGLSALIPQAAQSGQVDGQGRGVLRLAIESIKRDSANPRKQFEGEKLRELADSIKAQGLLQPVLVRKEGNHYRLIAGERRWRASQMAGLKEIPALVREATEREAFEMALVENLQRADLNPIEEADGYQRLIDEHGLTQEQVSQRVGKDRSSVANALRLLGLPEDVKEMVAEGALSMGHARALLGVPRIPELNALAKRVAAEKLSVRDTEKLVRDRKDGAGGSKSGKASAKKETPGMRAVLDDLQRALGTKVRIDDRDGKGTLAVDFFSYEDLDRIIAIIRK